MFDAVRTPLFAPITELDDVKSIIEPARVVTDPGTMALVLTFSIDQSAAVLKSDVNVVCKVTKLLKLSLAICENDYAANIRQCTQCDYHATCSQI